MKRILFMVILSLVLMVCFTSPTWAGGLDDCKAYKEGEKALSKEGNFYYKGAIGPFTTAILSCELSREDLSKVYCSRGIAWLALDDPDVVVTTKSGIVIDCFGNAIADFTKAIELDPKNSRAYYNRGRGWSRKGDPDRAIADFTKAIELDPKNSRAYHDRGWAWSDKGNEDKAKADHDKAKELGYYYPK